jgi:hypothetical protein
MNTSKFNTITSTAGVTGTGTITSTSTNETTWYNLANFNSKVYKLRHNIRCSKCGKFLSVNDVDVIRYKGDYIHESCNKNIFLKLYKFLFF